MNDIIGIFYELPDGSIAKVYGRNEATQTIRYYFVGAVASLEATDNEWQTWHPRPDLKRFPGDRSIPSEFQQRWGISSFADLQAALDSGNVEVYEIRATMDEYGVDEAFIAEQAGIVA